MRKITTRAIRSLRYFAAYVRPPRPQGSHPESDYADFLQGATVALVGPAPTVVGSGLGMIIDSFDRVARLNHALPIPMDLVPDVGSRTDILYHNLWKGSPTAPPFEELAPVLQESVKWVCAVHPYSNAEGSHADNIDAFLAVLQQRVPFRTVSPRDYLRSKWRNRCRPSAGISAIRDLLRFGIKELFISGFTFYQGKKPYHENYRGAGPTPWLHSPDRELAQIRRWVESDSRIRLDDTLEAIVASGMVSQSIKEKED